MDKQKIAALMANAMTNIMITLALVPLSAILPTVADYFGVDAVTASWLQTSYLLTLTSFLLISGRLGDLYGHRDVYLAGAVLFTVVSTVSGFVQDIGILIVLRSLQGIAGALMSGNVLAIITNTFSAKERGIPIGVSGMSASAGAFLGVVVSTSLAQYFDWQWLFYMTLPLGLIAIKSALDLKVDFRPAESPKVDYWGAALLAGTLTIFSLSFSHLHSGEVGSDSGLHYHGGLLAATAVGLLVFGIVESRVKQPMVEIRYLLNLPFTFSVMGNEILHMTMMASSFLMPFLLEKGLGLSPGHTAGVLIATQIGNIAMSPTSGMIYDRLRWRFFCPAAMSLVALGLGVMALFAPTLPYLGLLFISLALGACLGTFQTPNNTVIMGTVPANLRGFAAGMIETSRQMGHMLGISASSAVMGVVLAGASDPSQGSVYMAAYQYATVVAAGIAFLGIFAALVHPLSRRGMAELSPELAKVG